MALCQTIILAVFLLRDLNGDNYVQIQQKMITINDRDHDNVPILAKEGRKPLYKAAGPSPRP